MLSPNALGARTGDETECRDLADLGSRTDPTALWVRDVGHNSNLWAQFLHFKNEEEGQPLPERTAQEVVPAVL